MKYIAFIHKEQDRYVGIVPDISHTSSYGESPEETLAHLTEACQLYVEGDDTLPVARPLSILQEEEMIQDDALSYVLEI